MIVPFGTITVDDAITRIGLELHGSHWSGNEKSARTGLVSLEQWELDKNTPAKLVYGGGAPGAHYGVRGTQSITPIAPSSAPDPITRYPYGDPTDPGYQSERKAAERWVDAKTELLRRLEAGVLRAIVVDPWSGQKHELNTSVWRKSQRQIERYLSRREAPMPGGANVGHLYILEVPTEPRQRAMPLQSKERETIQAAPAKADHSIDDVVAHIEELGRAFVNETGRRWTRNELEKELPKGPFPGITTTLVRQAWDRAKLPAAWRERGRRNSRELFGTK